MDLDTLAPITTVWTAGAIVLGILEQLNFVSSYQLFYSPRLVFHSGQYWRIATAFFYFGPFDLWLVLQLLFSMRYSYMLEMQTFGSGRRAAYTWFLLLLSITLLLVDPVLEMSFLGNALNYALMYHWCRKNRHVQVNLVGLITITAPYMPFFMMAFGWVMNAQSRQRRSELAGVVVGHLCSYMQKLTTVYFFQNIWPHELNANHTNILAPPLLWFVFFFGYSYTGVACGMSLHK